MLDTTNQQPYTGAGKGPVGKRLVNIVIGIAVAGLCYVTYREYYGSPKEQLGEPSSSLEQEQDASHIARQINAQQRQTAPISDNSPFTPTFVEPKIIEQPKLVDGRQQEEKIERERQRIQELHLYEEALQAPTHVNFVKEPSSNYQQSNTHTSVESQPFTQNQNQQSTDSSMDQQLSSFAGANKPNRWQLKQGLQDLKSIFSLQTGALIPATLLTGVNSDLPGQLLAQVSKNVYDSVSGQYLLIPQGSRLVGTYSNQINYGQGRLFIAWQRLLLPNGQTMDLGAMPGSDEQGMAGLSDQVNNHYTRTFASAFLMSGISAGVNLSQKSLNNRQSETASSIMSAALGQQIGDVASQIIAKNLNVAPTLSIREGFQFNVNVIKDIDFAKAYGQ